jgi:hypothetical protein
MNKFLILCFLLGWFTSSSVGQGALPVMTGCHGQAVFERCWSDVDVRRALECKSPTNVETQGTFFD